MPRDLKKATAFLAASTPICLMSSDVVTVEVTPPNPPDRLTSGFKLFSTFNISTEFD